MRVADFDYYLPDELIAQEPAPVRDESRLMVLHKNGGEPEHRLFKDIVEYLEPRDLLVVNDTKVIPARLWGKKEGTGTTIEVLLLTRRDEHTWETLVRPGRRVPPGTNIIFGDAMTGTVMAVVDEGCRLIKFHHQGVFEELLDRLGVMPLPPYIKNSLRTPGAIRRYMPGIPAQLPHPLQGCILHLNCCKR